MKVQQHNSISMHPFEHRNINRQARSNCEQMTCYVHLNRLLADSVISRADHVLRPLFPPIIIRRPGLCCHPHDFSLPTKDDSNLIPRILHRTLLHHL